MICLCGCNREFEPTKWQQKHIERGHRVFYTKECRVKWIQERDKNRTRTSKYIKRHCLLCGHDWKQKRIYKTPRYCPSCKCAGWMTGNTRKSPTPSEGMERIKLRVEERIDKDEIRVRASLHCEKYDECMSIAGKSGKNMNCHKCESPLWLKNAWQKTREMYDNIDYSYFHVEHSVILPGR